MKATIEIDGKHFTGELVEDGPEQEFHHMDWVWVTDNKRKHENKSKLVLKRYYEYNEGHKVYDNIEWIIKSEVYSMPWAYVRHAYDVPGVLHKWYGGENPYANNPDARVTVWARNGKCWTNKADHLRWSHKDEVGEIVAFMLMPED